MSGTHSTPTKTPDTVLILGAQVKGNSKETAYPSTILKERLNTAITYLKRYPEAQVVVCGGKGMDEADNEANVMATYLIEHGIPEESIIQEDTSTRTKENIQNAQKKTTLGNTVIITSDFHIFRSTMLAKRLGISNISALPAKTGSTLKFKMYTREIISLSYALIFDW